MDITKETIDYLAQVTPGNAAIYQIERGRVKALYISPGIPALNGMTMAEYLELVTADSLNIVLPEDRHLVLTTVQKALHARGQIDCYFRVFHKRLGMDWAHLTGRWCGELAGKPVVLAIYTNASVETDMYQRVLDHSQNITYVCDKNTYQLLYANRAAKEHRQAQDSNFSGQTCYAYNRGLSAPCAECTLQELQPGEVRTQRCYNPVQGTWEQRTSECLNWCGHDAFVQYVVDISEDEKRNQDLRNVLEAAEFQLKGTRVLDEQRPLDERLSVALSLVGTYYQADRTYIFTIDGGGKTVSNTYEWCREGVKPQIGILQNMDLHYIDGWMPFFKQQQSVLVPDIEKIRQERPAEYDVMIMQDIHSYMETPLFLDGQLVGFVGVDNPSAEKMLNSSDMLSTFAYSLASALHKQQYAEKLQETQRILQDAVNNTDIQYFTYFPGRKYLEIYVLNEHYAKLPTKWENYPESFIDYVKMPAEDAKLFRSMIQKLAAGANEAGSITRMTYEGRQLWMKVQFTAIKNEEGQTIKLQGYASNVTEQKKAEERLFQERVRLKTMGGNIFEAFTFNVTKNTQASLQTSDKEVMLLPVRPEVLQEAEFYAPPIRDEDDKARQVLLHVANRIPDAKDRVLYLSSCGGNGVRKAVKEGKFEQIIRYRRQIGKVVHWVSSSIEILPDPNTGELFAFFYTRDIHEEIIHEKALRQILDRNYERLSWYDVQTGLIHVREIREKTATAVQGIDYVNWLEETTQSFVLPEEMQEVRSRLDMQVIKEQLADKLAYVTYYTRRERSSLPGHPYKRMRNDIFYLDEHQDVIIFLVNDVTEIFEQEREVREKMGAAMRAAEAANQAKTEFLSRISHDIRTPINAITGMTAFAKIDLDDKAKVQSDLAKIEDSTKHLLSLINDVLDISRAESGKITLHPEPYAFDEYIRSVRSMFEPLCEQNKQRFVIKGGLSGQGVVVDRVRFDQIMINLLSNALKYTPSGGTITYASKSKVLPGGKIDCCFTIADTGIGMSEAFQKVMFEPFSQERDNAARSKMISGTGLGLSIVQRLVQLMGGTISVHSQLGKGTELTVRFCLPQATPAQLEQCRLKAVPFYKGRQTPLKGRILLAEDNALNQEIAVRLLRSFGLEVDVAENGQEAVQLFKKGAEGLYQAVLMDIQMPIMNGYEAAARLRALPRADAVTIPIIALTADAFVDDVKKCLAVGMNGHVAKPINPRFLYHALQMHLQKQD